MAAKRIVIFGWAQSVHIQRWTAGLQKRGFDIKLISLGGSPLPDIETVVFPYGAKMEYLRRAQEAARVARKFKPDIVHVHYAGGFGIWGLRTAFKPAIYSIWGSDIRDFSKYAFLRFLMRQMLHFATHITAASQYLEQEIIKLVPDATSKVSVIPFGVELPNTIPPMPTSPPVRLCFIKAHSHVYGPDILLHALAEVKKEIPDIHLSMAGKGDQTEQLQQLVQTLGLDDNVRFTGFIDNEWMYHFLSEHHIMVMPSRHESFGVAALEASACGRPVIASNVGGIPEIVLNNLNGLVVPPDDVPALASAICKLARDAATRQAMGDAGQRLVLANYTWEKSLDLMAALYERVIHDRKKNSPV